MLFLIITFSIATTELQWQETDEKIENTHIMLYMRVCTHTLTHTHTSPKIKIIWLRNYNSPLRAEIFYKAVSDDDKDIAIVIYRDSSLLEILRVKYNWKKN